MKPSLRLTVLMVLTLGALTLAVTALAAVPIRIVVNDREVATDVSPVNIDGRVMVPIRFVAQALGADVTWDGATQTVSVHSKTATSSGNQEVVEVLDGSAIPYSPSFRLKKVSARYDDVGVLIITGSVLNATGDTRQRVSVFATLYDQNGHTLIRTMPVETVPRDIPSLGEATFEIKHNLSTPVKAFELTVVRGDI